MHYLNQTSHSINLTNNFIKSIAGDMKTFLIKNEASLLDEMKGSNGDSSSNLNSRLLVQWAYNIAKGMRYLSRKHIMHGDLAARNILIGRGKFKYRIRYILRVYVQ